MRGRRFSGVSVVSVRKAAYRCVSPVTSSHHQVVPGVAGDDALRQVSVRPSSSNCMKFIVTPEGDFEASAAPFNKKGPDSAGPVRLNEVAARSHT
jgi:hypothetical protein